MSKTFTERCKMFEQCLPDASYRDLLKELHTEMLAKLAEQPAPVQQEPVAIPDVEFMRQVLSVAIVGLYYHYKDDVLKVFSPNDLQNVVDLSESLVSQQVEDIYRRAWDMLAILQSAPVQEPVAWVFKPHNEFLWPYEVERKNPIELDEYMPLYTTPQAQPAREPLTEDEMWELHAKYPALPEYTRAIEAAHNIKENT